MIESLPALLSENVVYDESVRERNLRGETAKLLESEKLPGSASLLERVVKMASVETLQGLAKFCCGLFLTTIITLDCGLQEKIQKCGSAWNT